MHGAMHGLYTTVRNPSFFPSLFSLNNLPLTRSRLPSKKLSKPPTKSSSIFTPALVLISASCSSGSSSTPLYFPSPATLCAGKESANIVSRRRKKRNGYQPCLANAPTSAFRKRKLREGNRAKQARIRANNYPFFAHSFFLFPPFSVMCARVAA